MVSKVLRTILITPLLGIILLMLPVVFAVAWLQDRKNATWNWGDIKDIVTDPYKDIWGK